MRLELVGHDVYTVAYMGWSGVRNGELLKRAAAAGFDALVTNDRGLEHQQNLSALPLAVVIVLVSTNTLEALRPAYPALLGALTGLQPCEVVKVSVS